MLVLEKMLERNYLVKRKRRRKEKGKVNGRSTRERERKKERKRNCSKNLKNNKAGKKYLKKVMLKRRQNWNYLSEKQIMEWVNSKPTPRTLGSKLSLKIKILLLILLTRTTRKLLRVNLLGNNRTKEENCMSNLDQLIPLISYLF